MTDHDPLCPLRFQGGDSNACHECAHARRIRADERERIAQAIEARVETHECGRAYRHAARIARGDA